MKESKTIAGAILAAFAVLTAAGHATVLTQVFNNDTATALTAGDTDNATTLPGDTTSATEFSFGSSPSGSLVSWALTGDTLNPFGASDLTLVYQLADFNDQVNTLSLNGFNLPSVYMGFNGSGVAPSEATLNNGVLSLSFPGIISPGGISDYLYVYTSDTLSSVSTANAVDSANSTTSNGAQILAPVPEPSSVAMLLAGFASLGFIARHRRAARRV